jgi:hypothetical protein
MYNSPDSPLHNLPLGRRVLDAIAKGEAEGGTVPSPKVDGTSQTVDDES